MAEVQQTAEEVFDSLTGFDEMAITQHFGKTINDLAGDPTMFGRALAFVVERRGGASDDEARTTVLGMALKDVTGYFAEETDASGKDEPSPESPQVTSPPSVI
jgi:hypothetical protein